ncbi:MAG: hypothetical protein AAGB11_21055, partial [Pseudomonadota bacterium]
TISGIASGVGRDFEAPRRPLAEPETATFAFLPFSGIPGNVGDNMLRRIWKQADREGLKVVKRPDGAALFTVEGVLTAISDDTNSLVFFVFDVKDVTGRRLHRISGQQRSEESAGDPWSNVSNRDLDKIAERLVALLRAWLNADEHPMGRLPTMAGGGNAPG